MLTDDTRSEISPAIAVLDTLVASSMRNNTDYAPPG